MSILSNKRILLGITGGIAAYKCAELTRRLSERGAEVRIVMTASAKEFITPLTMQAVSGNPVADSLLDPSAEAGMNHIELAKWADLVLIAPASANFIARMRAGMANDLLTTLCLATPSPVAVAPAMNQQMYQAIPTQENLAALAERGIQLWGPSQGEQACGDVGPGRMLEPMELVAHVEQALQPKAQPLAGKKILLTAGPTREAIDPVRYISNHSSGKMGYALAAAAVELGADVTLISGPVNLPTPAQVTRIDVESSLQMHDATVSRSQSHDIFIACAAVSDYRPVHVAEQKIKKTDQDDMQIQLIKNPDILADVAAQENGPFTVGFAAETQDVARYARDKLIRKGLNMIAANDVAQAGQGFNADNNALSVFWPQGQHTIALADKHHVARQLLQLIAERYETDRS